MNSKKQNRRLVYLEDLKDYKMADGDPDVRGWNIHDANNDNVGVISGLIVDPEKEKVVYLDVDIRDDIIAADHDPFDARHYDNIREYQDKEGDIHMIVPIGAAHVDRVNKKVLADGINQGALRNFPMYRYNRENFQLHPEYERMIMEEYLREKRYREGMESRLDESDVADEDYYTPEHLDEDRFYGRHHDLRDQRRRDEGLKD